MISTTGTLHVLYSSGTSITSSVIGSIDYVVVWSKVSFADSLVSLLLESILDWLVYPCVEPLEFVVVESIIAGTAVELPSAK